MINHACPVIVLDDDKQELWKVSHGLTYCGFPVMSHWINNGTLEREPETPYVGVRLFFTDLHLLGPTMTRPEIYVGALINFIKRLIRPSNYVIVFWSNYADEAEQAWAILKARLEPEYHPIAFKVLDKSLADNAVNDDDEIAMPAREELKLKISEIINAYPQLQAVINWESSVSQAASETTNQLLNTIKTGKVSIRKSDNVRNVFARMSQEALGLPYAILDPVKGFNSALIPILQDNLEKLQITQSNILKNFLAIHDDEPIKLPKDKLKPLLNDFFIHAENDESSSVDRGALTRLDPDYLRDISGFTADMGLSSKAGDWRETICAEFYIGWAKSKDTPKAVKAKKALRLNNVYAIELSAICDYAQDKQRSHRYLLALFVPDNDHTKLFISNNKKANDAIYSTPQVTINQKAGLLLVSCRIYLTKPYKKSVSGQCVSRLRKDVIDELSHHYATHMRRPGKVAFY